MSIIRGECMVFVCCMSCILRLFSMNVVDILIKLVKSSKNFCKVRRICIIRRECMVFFVVYELCFFVPLLCFLFVCCEQIDQSSEKVVKLSRK